MGLPSRSFAVDVHERIKRYLGEHDDKPKPFVWTADPDRIIEKVNRKRSTAGTKRSH